MAFWWLLSVYWFNQSNKRSNPSTPLYERISCIFYLCSVPKIEIPTLLTGIYCISPSYQSTIVLYLKQIILVTQHTKSYDEACCFGILLLVYKTKLPFYHVVIHTLLSSKWLLAPSRLHTCQNGALRDGQWCPPPPPPPLLLYPQIACLSCVWYPCVSPLSVLLHWKADRRVGICPANHHTAGHQARRRPPLSVCLGVLWGCLAG